MSAEPLVSVLLPMFDCGATLALCLRSVERQSWRSWECVLVDDGSTDDSRRQALGFARRDDRFRVVTRPHRGLVAALNTGLEACRGELVARMDADDVMHRRRLERQAGALVARPDWAGVGCHVRLFPRDHLRDGYREYEAWLNGIDTPQAVRREAFVECPVAHPSLVLRRSRLAALGYRDQGWPEDYDLLLRLLTGGDEVGVVPHRLLGWRHGPDRLSRNAPAYRIDRFTSCKARFLADSFLADSPHYILWGYGGTGRALRRALEAIGKRPSHIVELHPGRLGNRIHGAPVVPPSELPRLPRRPVVVSVAGRGPRTEVRRKLATLGFVETRDFVCAA
jgi:glycosyltransferase involved in cell wall biosynthesis